MEAISGRKTIQEIAADHYIHTIQVSQWKRQLLDGASVFTRGKKSKDKEEGQAKEAELFQQIGRLQMELEWLKKISAALRPMNCESWSITTSLSSASAVSVCCLAWRDRRSTTGRCQCVSRRCGSWPGSTLSTWRIPAAAAGGWSLTWPEKEFRSAVTESETSCAAWVCGRPTGNPAPRFQAIHPSGSPAWWISGRSRRWIKPGPPTSPTSRCRRDSSTWWRSWICSPGTCTPSEKPAATAGSSPTALTRSSVSMPWRWHWKVAAGTEIFHSDQGCQFTSGAFVARLHAEEIKISWSGRKRCYDNILVKRLWRTVKYEEVYLHAYRDGWEAKISLARFLWRYCHVRPHSSLGGKTPHEVYIDTEPCSSRLELTIPGARAVQ